MSRKQGTVLGGFIWNLLERVAAQGVTLVVGIILARKLGTDAYGTVALVSAFIALMTLFTGFSTGTALIQKKEVDDLDYNSIFYFTAGLSVIIYLIIFFTAPLVANFYERPELVWMIRVLAIVILIQIFQGNQCVIVSRTLRFRLFFFATLGGTVGAAIIGIVMAYTGFGAWALVAQMVFNSLIDTLLLWFLVKWRPKLMFSWARVKALLGFSIKLWGSNLLENVSTKIQSLVIGKVYTSSDLALYNKGESFPSTLVSSINSSVNNVLFPTISKLQDDREKVCSYTSRAIRFGSFVIWPLMVGLAAVAKPMLGVLLGEEWLDCALFVQIFCLGYAFMPISTANLSAIKAVGRSDLILKLNTIVQVTTIAVLLVTVWFGPVWIAVGLVGVRMFGQFINAFPSKKLFGYGYSRQLRDILPSVGVSLAMGIPVYLISYLPIAEIYILLIQIPTGIGLYILLSWFLQREMFRYTLSLISGLRKKKNTAE